MKLVNGKTVVSAENAKFKVSVLRLTDEGRRMMSVKHPSEPAKSESKKKSHP